MKLSVNAQWHNYIGGRAVPPVDGTFLREINPRTRQETYSISKSSEADVENAVMSAKEAWPAWRDLRPIERGRILLSIAKIMRERRQHLAEIEVLETGRSESQALAEVQLAADYFEFYGGLVNLFRGEVIDLGAGYHSFTRREPYGVVGVILPWNGPLNQAGRAIAPALAAANVVVAKPSEFTSVTLLELARLAVEEAGLPKGVLNIVTGYGREAGASLVSHEQVRKVAFTGSVRAGREIGRIAADRIIPLSLELGGKSPNIVFADCDMDKAAAGSIRAFTVNAGQVCSAGSRCLVQRSAHDDFVKRLKRGLESVKIGCSNLASIGPIITQPQYERIQEYVRSAKDEGYDIFEGGVVEDEEGFKQGWYVRPMLLTNVNNRDRLAREEIFGPILAVIPFDDEDDAIQIANDTDYGLVAGLWTSNLQRAHRVAAALEAGQVFVNEYFAGGIETPFGGYKQSGYGREKGIEAIHHYTQLKCVTMKLKS